MAVCNLQRLGAVYIIILTFFNGCQTQLCEPITTPICKGLGYNVTFFPNLLGHDSQTEAGLEATTYQPLVTIDCSPQLRLFLCSLYMPVCTVLTQPVPPCQELCLEAKRGCSALMNRFGHDWPEHFQCKKFPKRSTSVLCIDEAAVSTNSGPLASATTQSSSIYSTGAGSNVHRHVPSPTTCTPRNISVTMRRGHSQIKVEVEAGSRFISLGIGDYTYTVRDGAQVCPTYVRVVPARPDDFIKRRVELRATYRADCASLKQDDARRIEVAAKLHFKHLRDVCGKVCSRNKNLNLTVACSYHKLVITWPTDLEYPGTVPEIPLPVSNMLTSRLIAKGAMMMIPVPSRRRVVQFPEVTEIGAYAQLVLTPFCLERKVYNEQTTSCE